MLILILRFLNFICSFFFLVLHTKIPKLGFWGPEHFLNLSHHESINDATFLRFKFNYKYYFKRKQTFNSWEIRIRSSFFFVLACNICYFAIFVCFLFAFSFYWFDSLSLFFRQQKAFAFDLAWGYRSDQRINETIVNGKQKSFVKCKTYVFIILFDNFFICSTWFNFCLFDTNLCLNITCEVH